MDAGAREFYSIMSGETNPVGDIQALLARVDWDAGMLPLSDTRVVRIERLRLIGYAPGEFPFWEVSYCFGKLADGRLVRVDIGDACVQPRINAHLVELCKEAGRDARKLGIFGAVSKLPG